MSSIYQYNGVSNRSVMHMKPDQVARKRAFDRENQKASRAKTKARITYLERELASAKRELSSAHQQISQLQENVRSLERNRTELQAAIEASYLSIQSLRNLSNLTESTIVQSSSVLSHGAPEDVEEQPDGITAAPTWDGFADQSTEVDPVSDHLGQSASENHAGVPITEVLPLNNDSWNSVLLDQDWLVPIFGEMPSNFFTLSSNMDNGIEYHSQFQISTTIPHSILASSSSSIDPSATGHEDSHPNYCEPPVPESPANATHNLPQLTPKNRPPWTVLPKLDPPSCRLDHVLGNLIRVQTYLSNNQSEFSDPAFPSVASLLNPLAEVDPTNEVSYNIGKQIVDFTFIDGLPERIAILWMFSLITRWHVSPTQKNYESLPWFLRPIQVQIERSHPLWIECVVWPEARTQIIQNMSDDLFESFRLHSNSTISVNWPYDASSALMAVSNSKVMLSPAFEQHLRNLDNWTFGQEMVDALPFLAGTLKIK